MNRYITLVALLLSCFAAGAQEINPGFGADCSNAPADLVRGNAAGVRVSSTDGNINGALNVNIRGINSLRTSAQPLWIVDGVYIGTSLQDNLDAFWQYSEKSYTSLLNQFASLNSYDIESIEVLSDLSATALYGARGANGVIIIKTKRPKEDGNFATWHSALELSTPVQSGEYFRPGLGHRHCIEIGGNKNNTSCRISLDFKDGSGVVDRNNSTSGGLSASFDTKANPVVWFGLSARVSLSELNSVGGAAYLGQPSLMMALRSPERFPLDTAEGWLADYDDNASDRRLFTSAYLTLNFTPSLSLKTSVGIDFENNNRYIWYGNGTSFGLESDGAASLLSSSMCSYNASSVLSWNKYFSTKHHLSLKAGVEGTGNMNKFNTLSGLGFFTHELRAKGLNIMDSAAKIRKFNHDWSQCGLFAYALYDFDGKAGVNATIRADITPKYDSAPILYPALSVWADVAKLFFGEGFFDSLCLRAGYGIAGSEKYVPYGLLPEYVPAGGYPVVSDYASTFYDGLWRLRSREFSAGVDFSIKNGLVRGSACVYYKNTDDSLKLFCFGEQNFTSMSAHWDWAPRKEAFGIVSGVANRGVEASVEVRALKCLTLRANAAYNVNQITEIASGDMDALPIGGGTACTRNVLGRSVSQFCGYLENEDGSYVDLNKDGKVDVYDRTLIGCGLPRLHGGLGATLRLRSFSLDVLAEGAAGFEILNMSELVQNRQSDFTVSDRYAEKGDYLRLSRATLSWDAPLKGVKWLKGLTLSGTATNLFTITAYGGWNPDINCFGGSPSTIGVDYGSYPAIRSFILSACLKF